MNTYFVSKDPAVNVADSGSSYIGCFTLKTIRENLTTGRIKPDYFATADLGVSYNELVKIGGVAWIPVSELLAATPAEILKETIQLPVVEQRSGWATFFRVTGMVTFLIGFAGCVIGVTRGGGEGENTGLILFAIGLACLLQSFVFAFLIDVLTDIRFFLRKLADDNSAKGE